MSGSRDVLDEYKTWALNRRAVDSSLLKNGKKLEQFEMVRPGQTVDLSKRSGFSGSVQYFHDFTLDTSAWPSPDLNRLDVHLWNPPYYHVDSPTIIPENWRELLDEKKSGGGGGGGACFNCGKAGHSLNACPSPKDQERIRKAIAEWKRSRIEDVEVRYHSVGAGTNDLNSSNPSAPNTPVVRAPPKAGVLSERLRQALGLEPDQMPPWYRNIVYYGYPPSYYRVPSDPVKFTWVESESNKNAGSNSNDDKEGQKRQRVRTISFPNLAAPLHDLSLYLDLYHPVEDKSPELNETGEPIASDPRNSRKTKYQVTTQIDGVEVPSRSDMSHSGQISITSPNNMVIDLTDEDGNSNFKTPNKNPKKRSRDASTEIDLIQNDDIPTGEAQKIAKTSKDGEEAEIGPSEKENSQNKEEEAESWADTFLDKIKKDKVISASMKEDDTSDSNGEQDQEEENQSVEDLPVNLPVGDGTIRHNLTEQDLSTHGSAQQSTGVWAKLKHIFDERKRD